MSVKNVRLLDLTEVDAFPAFRQIVGELAPDGYTARVAPDFSEERHGFLNGWHLLLTRDADGAACQYAVSWSWTDPRVVPEQALRDLASKAIETLRGHLEEGGNATTTSDSGGSRAAPA